MPTISRSDVRKFACPACNAPRFMRCVGANGKLRTANHAERLQIAIEQAAYERKCASLNATLRSWWDTICDIPDHSAVLYYNSYVLNDAQWKAMAQLQDQEWSDRKQRARAAGEDASQVWMDGFYPWTPEDRFMLLCFLHEACADLGMAEAY